MACHTSREQRDLLRVVRAPDGAVRLDLVGRANGRGAYVCRDASCITNAARRGALARALAAPIPDDLATDLQRQLPVAPPETHPDLTIAGGTLGQE